MNDLKVIAIINQVLSEYELPYEFMPLYVNTDNCRCYWTVYRKGCNSRNCVIGCYELRTNNRPTGGSVHDYDPSWYPIVKEIWARIKADINISPL